MGHPAPGSWLVHVELKLPGGGVRLIAIATHSRPCWKIPSGQSGRMSATY